MSETNSPFRFSVLGPEYHRACGVVKGCLVGHCETTNKAHLVCPDGSSFAARIINPGGKKLAERGWQNFMVYPHSEKTELCLSVSYPRKDQSEPDRYFEVQGVVYSIDENYITMAVWSESQQHQSYVRIKGFLPGAKKGQVWWLECELERDALYLVDGLKVAAKWTKPPTAPDKVIESTQNARLEVSRFSVPVRRVAYNQV